MLKIKRIRDQQGIRICLSGALRCAQLPEMLAELREAARALTLDLDEVDVVDIDGVRLLNECEAQGIQVANCPPYIREWMLQESDSQTARNSTQPPRLEWAMTTVHHLGSPSEKSRACLVYNDFPFPVFREISREIS